MPLRARWLASTSILITSVCAGALAQTPTSSNKAATTDQAAAAAELVQHRRQPNRAVGSARLPTINVSGKRKPPPHPRARAPKTAANSPATAPAPASPYETGAPNVGRRRRRWRRAWQAR